jgi:hypothetical protein
LDARLPGSPGDGPRFLRDGVATATPVVGDGSPMLFDKWFEERETQAAGSWRIRWANARRVEQTLAISAFQAITMARQVRGNPSRMRFV